MINIIKYNLRKQFKSIAIYLVALVGFALMYISLFPSMKKIDIEAMMAQMPKEFLGFLGEGGAASYGKIEGYLSGEFFSFFFILLVGFYVSSVAGSAIAGKIEKRVMDFDLSQPISRSKRLISETLVAMFYSFIIVGVVCLSTKLLCLAFDISISSKGLLFMTIIGTLFAWALYGIAIFISSITRSKIAVSGITVFITLASYIFYALSLAVEKIKDYGKYSLYNYYDPQKILSKSEISPEQCLVFLAIFAVGTAMAMIIFNKKDT
jgi:ABC-2 type transport system permease protein